MYGQPLWELVADLLGGLVHEVLGQQLAHHAVDHLVVQDRIEVMIVSFIRGR